MSMTKGTLSCLTNFSVVSRKYNDKSLLKIQFPKRKNKKYPEVFLTGTFKENSTEKRNCTEATKPIFSTISKPIGFTLRKGIAVPEKKNKKYPEVFLTGTFKENSRENSIGKETVPKLQSLYLFKPIGFTLRKGITSKLYTT
ncbi:hypothetical protein CEXT_563241 [Caerostris extrusa]|uniref:Uncharacterized protein n=1 Tax=Caerostris extrusa TaxID=172846 RepID=A0AAV4WTV7_CAEEX|nr:hypothetical protein CEXT_563241 [Caerostris extrusa]